MIKSKTRGLVVALFLIFSIASTVYLAVSPNTIDSITDISDVGVSDMNYGIMSSDASLPYQTSPFFNHSDDDIPLYTQLMVEDLYRVLFQHSFNNTDDYEVADSNVYSADQFYYLMGINRLSENILLVPNHIAWYQSTDLWDSDEGGYYTQVDENLTAVTETKTCFDNALAILAIMTGVGTPSEDVMNLAINQWNILESLFWDGDKGLYNQTTDDSSDKYTNENLLAAITGFEIAREQEFDGSGSLATIQSKAIDVMEELELIYFDNDYPSFYSENRTVNTGKSLLTNALGIIAMLDWNIAEGFSQVSDTINKTKGAYDFIKNNLYNNSNNLYNAMMSKSGSVIEDYTNDLLANAWMLKATVKLFEATGDIQYYTDALELFFGIENTLYDSANFGYNSNSDSDVKTTSSYNMLISSLMDLLDVYNSANIWLNATNASSYLYLDDTLFNVSLSLNYSMSFSYNTSAIVTSWDIETPIDNCDINYTLRYSNDSIIADSVDTSDVDGLDEYTYDISSMGCDEYQLSVLTSKTGYCYTFDSIQLEIISGLLIVEFEPIYDELYQGETGVINLTIASLREDNITIDIQTSGDNFDTDVTSDIDVINETLTFALVDVTPSTDAELGVQDFTVTFINNSFEIDSADFSLEISQAIVLQYLTYNEKLIELNPIDIEFVLENNKLSSSADNLHIEITGTYFETIDQDIPSVNADSSKTYNIEYNPLESAPLGEIGFDINITQAGEELYFQSYTVLSVSEIEVVSINTPEYVLQGSKPTATVIVNNNNLTSQTISIKSNGVTVWSGVIQSGENIITTEIDGTIWNPYSVSTKEYTIEVSDEDATKLATETVSIEVKVSVANVFFFYALPLIVPIAVILIFKYKVMENEKRK